MEGAVDPGDYYTSAGGKLSVGAHDSDYDGDIIDMAFKSVNERKGYLSDKEYAQMMTRLGEADGIRVSKSGVLKKLNMANVANQQGTIMDAVDVGEFITAAPTTATRGKLYASDQWCSSPTSSYDQDQTCGLPGRPTTGRSLNSIPNHWASKS